MKVTKSLIKKAIYLKSKKMKIEEIAKTLGVSARTVQKYTVNFPHPNRKILIPLPESARSLSKEKAEIIGYLCAEGCDFDTFPLYYEFDYRRNKTYKRLYKKSRVEFSNLNPTLQKRFQNIMFSVYNYKPKIDRIGNMKIYRTNIIKDLRSFTRFGSHKWNVPNAILNSLDNSIKSHFCRGYFDGDGTVDINRKAVVADSVNEIALNKLGDLLKSMGINFKLKNYKTRNRIIISDIKNYYKFISFVHPEKRKKLEKIWIQMRRSPNQRISF